MKLMADFIINHDCSKCALHKRDVKTIVPVEPGDIDKFKKLQIKIDNINNQINSASGVVGLASKDTREAYFTAAFKHRDEIQDQLTDWWDAMKSKYGVPDSVKADFDRHCFFECVDKDGNASLDGNFVPKED